MTDYAALLADIQDKLTKSLAHLEFSYQKIQHLTENVDAMDDETMETWESFTARFGRCADIFMNRYLRTVLLAQDPAYEGTLRDFLNKAEKMGMITDAKLWLEIRELRNAAVHDYNATSLTKAYRRLKELCPTLLGLKAVIAKNWLS